MIHRLAVKNLRVLEDVAIDLAPWTVLVGPNGCGKSSVLEAIDLATQIHRTPNQVFSGPRSASLLHRQGAQDAMVIDIAGTWGRKEGELRLEVSVDAQKQSDLKRSGVWDGVGFSTTIPEAMRLVVDAALSLRLQPRRLAEPSYTEDPKPSLEPDGTGLASVIADMQLRTPEVLEDLTKRLRAIVRGVKRIRVGLAKVRRVKREYSLGIEYDEVMGFELLLDLGGAKEVPAHQVSEGTILTLGLLTVILGPTRPRLILVDDIDRALHPSALGALAEQLRTLIEQTPDLQIVATSHSPYLADYLKPQELIVGAIDDSGSGRFARLSDHPDIANWRDLMRPGEFWSTVGEAWVTKRARTPAASGDE